MIALDTPVDTLVRYEYGGTRYGYVEEFNKKGTEVKVRPVPPYKGAQPRSRWIEQEDVEIAC